MVALTKLDEFFSSVGDFPPIHTLPDGVSITFQLTGDDGGTWTLERRKGHVDVHEGQGLVHPDCTLACTANDFRALIRGDLDPKRGFLDGRLEIEGDVGLVLRLRNLVG